jgi:NADPH:quinone reductase-like Zn-dependent oxidoreductase
MKDALGHELPLVPGWDFSGVVESVGQGVTGFNKGDEVFGHPDLSRNGAYAEFIVARPNEIAAKPRSIDHVHAAALPLTALTAWQALFDTARLDSGHRALILGASGGVGCAAVQLAKWRGAWVAGTASARNQDFLRDLGVDQPVDYESTRFEDAVKDVDVVLDTQGGRTQARAWQTLKPGGILVSIVGQPSPQEAARHGVRQTHILVHPDAAQLKQISSLVESGRLRPFVETILPLSEAARAQRLIQSGHTRGKIVLRVAPPIRGWTVGEEEEGAEIEAPV